MKHTLLMVLLVGCAEAEAVEQIEQPLAPDAFVRREMLPGTEYGEETMIQHQRGGVYVPGTYEPNNEVVITMGGLGGTLVMLPPPYPSPATPVYRMVLKSAVNSTVGLSYDGQFFAACNPTVRGWLDVQWTEFKYEAIGWGGGCTPL